MSTTQSLDDPVAFADALYSYLAGDADPRVCDFAAGGGLKEDLGDPANHDYFSFDFFATLLAAATGRRGSSRGVPAFPTPVIPALCADEWTRVAASTYAPGSVVVRGAHSWRPVWSPRRLSPLNDRRARGLYPWPVAAIDRLEVGVGMSPRPPGLA